ncbi:MAG: hypothetical protein GX424_08740 [Clostridiales bacterium]|nr:hypothetical protein [Clostridiales bacterium]
MNRTVCVSFCGVVTALCTALMFFTGLIPVGTYAFPAMAGALMIVIVVEMGTAWAWPVYAASSILSYLIAGDREASLLFILFFGYYPILKAVIERHKKGFVSYLLKFIVFNAAMIAEYFISITVLSVPQESFYLFGVNLAVVFLAAGNLVFAVYDFGISSLVVAYYRRLHPSVSRLFRMK